MVNRTDDQSIKDEVEVDSPCAKCFTFMNIPMKIVLLIIIFILIILLACAILFNFFFFKVKIEYTLRGIIIISFIGILIRLLYDFSKKNEKKIKKVSYMGMICIFFLLG